MERSGDAGGAFPPLCRRVDDQGHEQGPPHRSDPLLRRLRDLIDDADEGAAVFRKTNGEGDISDVLHAHKGRCHVVAEERLGGQVMTGWHELRQHLQLLTFNTGVPPAALQKLDGDSGL